MPIWGCGGWRLWLTVHLAGPALSGVISGSPYLINTTHFALHSTCFGPDPTSNPPKQTWQSPSVGTGAPPKWLPTPPVLSGTHGFH